MKDIEKFKVGDNWLLISNINSSAVIVKNSTLQEKKELEKVLLKFGMFQEVTHEKTLTDTTFKVIYISIHASSKCNLRCKYCFKKEQTQENISFETCSRFIDLIIGEYPKAEKYIVDPTGSAEPLLELDLILKIGDYCRKKSDEIQKEVLPMLVTNGTLLYPDTVKALREHGILFGVSIDGTKKENDANRVDYLNKGSYNIVMKNIKKIKDRSLLGVAVTLTSSAQNLVKLVKHLSKYFTAISIKPVRGNGDFGINENNIERIKNEYTKLYEFLVKETCEKHNFIYISNLLNGDDYFGKFILRCILNHKFTTRCDAGAGRFSLAPNGKIYTCPGAIAINHLEVGNIQDGIDKEKVQTFWNIQIKRKMCQECYARFVCGGECFVVSYYYSGKIDDIDPIMCNLKKHLFKLAVLYSVRISKNEKIYKYLYEGCIEKVNRFKLDEELNKVLISIDNKYSFTELKKIKDDFPEKFMKLKKK